jgi:hypothetical protein
MGMWQNHIEFTFENTSGRSDADTLALMEESQLPMGSGKCVV